MNLRYASFFLAALALGRAFSQSGTLDPTYGNAGISILQPGDFHDVSHLSLIHISEPTRPY